MLARTLDFTARHAFLPLLRILDKDRSLQYLAQVEDLHRKSLETIQSHQLDRLRRICTTAAAKSPFYETRFREAGVSPEAITFETLKKLPVLTREDLHRFPKDIRNRDYEFEDLRLTETGGTTFAPVKFYLDQEAYNHRRSAHVAFEAWHDYHPGDRIAYLWGAIQDSPATSWKSKLRTEFANRVRFYPSLPLDQDILERYIADLRKFEPKVLQAYPAALDILGRHLLESGRTLPIPVVVSSAEPLTAEVIALVQEAFGVTPYDFYGSRDAGYVGRECDAHKGLHINAYGLHVENESLPTEGAAPLQSIVVTDLWNEGFPLIRYATEDLGELTNEPCTCGRALPRIVNLQGRIGDVFATRSGQLIPPTGIRPGASGYDQSFSGIQIIQSAPATFEALIVPREGFDEPLAHQKVQEAMSDLVGEPVSLTLRIVSEIPREPSGKFRSMKRTFKLPST